MKALTRVKITEELTAHALGVKPSADTDALSTWQQWAAEDADKAKLRESLREVSQVAVWFEARYWAEYRSRNMWQLSAITLAAVCGMLIISEACR